MRVAAKHNINLGGKRIAGGEVFEVAEKDFNAIREYVTPVERVKDAAPSAPAEAPAPEPAPKNRTRKTASRKDA